MDFSGRQSFQPITMTNFSDFTFGDTCSDRFGTYSQIYSQFSVASVPKQSMVNRLMVAVQEKKHMLSSSSLRRFNCFVLKLINHANKPQQIEMITNWCQNACSSSTFMNESSMDKQNHRSLQQLFLPFTLLNQTDSKMVELLLFSWHCNLSFSFILLMTIIPCVRFLTGAIFFIRTFLCGLVFPDYRLAYTKQWCEFRSSQRWTLRENHHCRQHIPEYSSV